MSNQHTPHIKATSADFAETVLMPGDPLRSKFVAENFLENARLDGNMRVVTEGAQVMLGGNDCYLAMCHKCWQDAIRAQKNK